MTDERTLMEKALKEIVVPRLRQIGFKGSLPHFRRVREKQLDLLSFQYYSAGGSFVVEIAKAPAEGITTRWGKFIPPDKANVTWVNERLRLGSEPTKGIGDHWFKFGRRSFEPEKKPAPYEHFVSVAQELASLIDTQAESWWHAC